MSEGHQTEAGRQRAERLLQASRRLDWRFLLPDGELADVGYIGDPRSSLFESLQMFSRTVTLMDPGMRDHDRRFDVLVLQSATRRMLRDARALVRSGGWVYAEVDRFAGGWPPAALLHPRSCEMAARHGGLIDLELHWHWPSFDACTRIVPLQRGAAFGYLLSKGQVHAAARAKAAAGQALLDSGILGWGIRCFSLVARSPRGQ